MGKVSQTKFMLKMGNLLAKTFMKKKKPLPIETNSRLSVKPSDFPQGMFVYIVMFLQVRLLDVSLIVCMSFLI